ncbi:MAG: transglutaminase-like domain-containing protein [Tannerella sp.]|jgi:hypothetical protein|nr:transglutaminase-like domain-containing protein [Tannerella sp.]
MKTNYLIAGIWILLLAGCRKDAELSHFISDANERNRIEQVFNDKKTNFADTTLFNIFNQEMSPREREAMTFLYAYLPIGDIADYTGDFYLRNVQASFQAQEEMPWGKTIPEILFRHFVLPIRVNNENLDESRMVFYDELKERLTGLSLYDAVLEVNHWCHEKVIYTPSDARTSAPLASVKTAYGRCGEESTFTVAALRAAGIPARQVYTPRWAHTDNNHAWVEAWVEGKWYFFGACEPEPVLNLAWFNAPACRGMLMHTKVFGDYNGPEEVMERTECYTEINVIDHYAPAARTTVTVEDSNHRPLKDVSVAFKLYNYAEFYTVARKTTDEKGQCSLSAGKGDMLVWASKDGRFGYRKVSFGTDDHVTVVLDKQPGDAVELELDIVPPAEGNIPAEATEAQKEENARRLLEEDSIRNGYTATFYTREHAEALAGELGLDANLTAEYLLKSRGNWMEIEKYLQQAAHDKPLAVFELLKHISEKDIRDTPASVLLDHLHHTPEPFCDETVYYPCVLNPRISNEFLTPYRSFFRQAMDADFIRQAAEDPRQLVDWVKQHIRIRDELNPQRVPVMPAGVWKARIADTHSRNIFFVAAARSLNIPARIERVTGKVQYCQNGQWRDVDFEAAQPVVARQGKVTATYTPIRALDNPKYSNHFTIAKIRGDGTLQTLNFRNTSTDMGEGATWAGLLKQPLAMDEGNYLMISGTRMASGKVLARITSFTVQPGQTTAAGLVMRESPDDIQVIGSIDAEATFKPEGSDAASSILNTTGRGYFIIAVLGPRQEPTNHALRDIAQVKDDFERWGRRMILLFKDEQSLESFDRHEFGDLPETVTYGIDIDRHITDMLVEAMKLPSADSLPIFVIADTFGRVVFVSQGYTIGLGEQMMKVIHKL